MKKKLGTGSFDLETFMGQQSMPTQENVMDEEGYEMQELQSPRPTIPQLGE